MNSGFPVSFTVDGTPMYVNRSEYFIPLLGGYQRGVGSSNYVSPNIYSTYNYSINNSHHYLRLIPGG